MAQQPDLQAAMQVLHDHYGDSFNASLEDGKDDMARVLREKMHLSHSDAKRVVDALVAARSVRWEGRSPEIPNQEGQAITGPPVILGTWRL